MMHDRSALLVALDDLRQQTDRKTPRVAWEAFADAKREFERTAAENPPLGQGDPAPQDAHYHDTEATARPLSNLLGQRPLILSFYRGLWCPFCNLELAALHDALPHIRELGGDLAVCSPQTPGETRRTRDKHRLTCHVLSDPRNTLARAFGLVFALPPTLHDFYLEQDIDLERSNGDESHELPIPATYVIDKQAIIRYAFVDFDYTRRADPIEVISALKTALA